MAITGASNNSCQFKNSVSEQADSTNASLGFAAVTWRGLFKVIGRVIGLLLVWPYLLLYRLESFVLGRRRAFVGSSERVAGIPGLRGVYIRQAFYKRTVSHVGVDVYFGFMSVFSKPEVHIGDRVYIGRFCSVGWSRLEDEVMLADGVQVLSGRHQHRSAGAGGNMRDGPHHYEQVRIGTGSWVGANAVVMADVGCRVIVAAGGVVTKPVLDDMKVGGVPAVLLE